MTPKHRVGLLAGVAVFLAVLAAPPPAGLVPAGWRTAGVAILMAIWWLTEAVPIPATALLPIVLLPLVGAGSVTEVAAPYANPIIFLFLGGFLIALSMERWELHRRVALNILSRVGGRPRAILAGFMAATAFLSMWVSNSAVALMMLPIGISVVGYVEPAAGDGEGGAQGFALALMLGIAYASSIGGMGTLVGTPPNAFLAGFIDESYGIQIGFAEWMKLGLPLVLLSLPPVYAVLARRVSGAPPGDRERARAGIAAELEALGPTTSAEKRVALVFGLAAGLWIFRPLLETRVPGLSDAGIAIACGLLLFLLPAERGKPGVLDWEWAERLPWGVLILFGGGLSLAAAIDRTGLNAWLGGAAAGLADWPPWLFVALVTALVVMLTELTSNTATAAAFLPILGAVALEIGWDPRLLCVPAALAASSAFMLPIATPPNAIVYGSGRVTIPQMARAGMWANVIMTVLITGLALLLLPWAFGVPIP